MSAVLSPCRKYRYKLFRDTDGQQDKLIAYFGVNPSTACESKDDSTVRRWKGFSALFDANRMIVGNVFAYRSTDVNALARVDDPIGPKNHEYVSEIIERADILVPCWGSRAKLPKVLRPHLDKFIEILQDSNKPVMCFGKTASNDPAHPLMLPYSTQLVEW
jgi:hypothetical protein